MTQSERRERNARIAARRREGVLLKVIAAEFSMTEPAISTICKQLGVAKYDPPRGHRDDDFKCGHSKDPTNVRLVGGKRQCLECHRAAASFYWRQLAQEKLGALVA